MRENLDLSVEAVLGKEGGFVNHPRDNGGATNWGVTIHTLRAWRGRPVSVEDVRNLTRSEAIAIYKANYWDAVRGDDLPSGVDLWVFDAAINSGPSRAARWLQMAAGVKADGAVGPVTLAAVAKADPADLIMAMERYRMNMLRGHEDWDVFGRGWTNRVESITAKALKLAGAVKSKPEPRHAPFVPPQPPEPKPVAAPAKPVGIVAMIFAAIAAVFGRRT